ncbi:MAG TPA: G8 domain-containing protein [Candidatus Kapabacteria bacterium]|nr:G8 domain-containing protein [Candidatus Kapabacteria bacterium]
MKSLFWSCVLLFVAGVPAQANVRVSVASGAWSLSATWGGTVPMNGDSVLISPGDSVFLDTSSALLRSLIVQGNLTVAADTIFLDSNFHTGDTAVQIFGTLDAGTGWFALTDSVRPIVYIANGALFRTASPLPFDTTSIYDSLRTLLFACERQSTFEYYSRNLDLIDISYLANNLIGHAYGNLTLTGMVASFRANPIAVLGTLTIGFGTSVIPSLRKGNTIGSVTQSITLSGDVVNENKGESGSNGAGLHGCGMQSLENDVWSFVKPNSGHKDTCHWIGPSQVGSVVIAPNVVLAIRFYSDTACDSLDIIGTLTEEGGSCGGHLRGRAYSEMLSNLDASHPVDSFENLGLTIRSGENPYLGRTRVVRTSGYLPPGSNPADRPVLRYYSITPADGPQATNDEMTFHFHCDELNGANPNMLNFWRSRDRGSTWAFSGLTRYDALANSLVWDTTCVGFPNDSGSFYWMLSEGYTDIALPAVLTNFNAIPERDRILLEWETASEIGAAGFEIQRSTAETSSLIATFRNDPKLLAHSKYGGDYFYSDSISDTGVFRYDLYEVSQDGIRGLLASRTVEASGNYASLSLTGISYHAGDLQFTVSPIDENLIRVSIIDAIGRPVFVRNEGSNFEGQLDLPVTLVPGMYFVQISSDFGQIVRKMMIFGP